MNFSSIRLHFLLGVVALTLGCGGSDKTSGTGSPAPTGTTDSTESSTACSSASTNGRCTEGPSKGTSCCMPDEEDGTSCAPGTDCETVCKHCK